MCAAHILHMAHTCLSPEVSVGRLVGDKQTPVDRASVGVMWKLCLDFGDDVGDLGAEHAAMSAQRAVVASEVD